MSQRYRFGPYTLDAGTLILEQDGRPVSLRPKLVETLVALVEAAPAVASKETLMSRVWPDVNVVESSLTRNISELRNELESGCPNQTVIETLPKRGYRFALEVTREHATATPAPRAPSSRVLFAGVAVAVLLAILTLGARSPSGPAKNAAESSPSVAEAAFRSAFAAYDGWTVEGVEAAVFHFDRSIRAAPELWYGHYGSATAQLAALLLSGESGPEAKARLVAAADQAVLYGPEVAVTHAVRGSALLATSWDWDGSAREIEEAIRWNPKNAMPYARRGLWKTLRGRFDDARADHEHALELEPDCDECRLTHAFNELCAQRYDEAITAVAQVLPHTRKQQVAHRLLAVAYGARGDWTAAEEAIGKAGLSELELLEVNAWLLARRGNTTDASAAREELRARCQRDDASYCDTALIDTALGDPDAAFDSLERGLRRRHWKLLVRSVDPRLAALHADDRWRVILRTIHGQAGDTLSR